MKPINPIIIETSEGYKLQVTINMSIDGAVVVKGAAFLGRLVSPSFPIKSFRGKNAGDRALNYVTRLTAALLDEPLDQDVTYDTAVGE